MAGWILSAFGIGKVGYFLEAYSSVPGRELTALSSSERPDFICSLADGSTVGLELVKVVRDPQLKWADEVFFRGEHMEAGEAFLRIAQVIAVKESKRSADSWNLRDRTILVVQVMDCPLDLFQSELDPDCFPPHNFEEICLADYSELEAYGNVELFCAYPPRLWGYYPSTRGKPYG